MHRLVSRRKESPNLQTTIFVRVLFTWIFNIYFVMHNLSKKLVFENNLRKILKCKISFRWNKNTIIKSSKYHKSYYFL